jgi:hypothetical protein
VHSTWPQQHGMECVLVCFHVQLGLTMPHVDHANQVTHPCTHGVGSCFLPAFEVSRHFFWK